MHMCNTLDIIESSANSVQGHRKKKKSTTLSGLIQSTYWCANVQDIGGGCYIQALWWAFNATSYVLWMSEGFMRKNNRIYDRLLSRAHLLSKYNAHFYLSFRTMEESYEFFSAVKDIALSFYSYWEIMNFPKSIST